MKKPLVVLFKARVPQTENPAVGQDESALRDVSVCGEKYRFAAVEGQIRHAFGFEPKQIAG